MSRIREVSSEHKSYLSKVKSILESTLNDGIPSIHLWKLDVEIKFIDRVVRDNSYDLYNDSDRLNSLINLVGYIQRKQF